MSTRQNHVVFLMLRNLLAILTDVHFLLFDNDQSSLHTSFEIDLDSSDSMLAQIICFLKFVFALSPHGQSCILDVSW